MVEDVTLFRCEQCGKLFLYKYQAQECEESHRSGIKDLSAISRN